MQPRALLSYNEWLSSQSVQMKRYNERCCVISDVWERSLMEAIIPNHFDEDGLWLKMIKITFEMVCDEIGALVSPGDQSHDLLRQSHMTFRCTLVFLWFT